MLIALLSWRLLRCGNCSSHSNSPIGERQPAAFLRLKSKQRSLSQFSLQASAMAFVALVLLGAAEAAVHRGYLYDQLCVNHGVGIDGVDSRTEPEKHTLDCLLFSPCIESGYGLVTKPAGQRQYSMEVLLSAQGNADVITWLTTQEGYGGLRK